MRLLKNYEKMDRLADIYYGIYATLKDNSKLNNKEFEKEIDKWRHYSEIFKADDDFFNLLLSVTFYSGFKAKTVDNYLENIKHILGNYKEVKDYTFDKVERILGSKDIIAHPGKICCTILNARKFHSIINKCGSFLKYLNQFNYKNDDDELFALCARLNEDFYYLGSVTAYHFLMDIGANVIKPDRQVIALLNRLGILRKKKNKNWEVVTIGRRLADVVNENIRVVDIILVTMGQGTNLGVDEPICPNKCNVCGVRDYCQYFRTGVVPNRKLHYKKT